MIVFGFIYWLISMFAFTQAFGQNDFSDDATCVALWRLESGALTTDSIGTNTLTNTGVAADTSIFQEGAAAGRWVNTESDVLNATDASLDSGFPFKDGTSNLEITVCFWLWPQDVASTRYVFCKSGNASPIRFFTIWYASSIHFRVGDGTTWAGAKIHAGDWAGVGETDQWYHVGVTYKSSDTTYRVRVWDLEAGTTLDGQPDNTGTTGKECPVNTQPLEIGRLADSTSNDLNGRLDEIVVFNRILTADEIDTIRAGTFGAASAGQMIITNGHVPKDEIFNFQTFFHNFANGRWTYKEPV